MTTKKIVNKKQLALIGIVFLLIATYFGAKMYASKVAENKLNKAIAKVSKFVKVEYQKVNVDLLDLDVHISGVTIFRVGSPVKVKISEIFIKEIDTKSDIPTFLDLSFNGIELDLNKPEGITDSIKELGYIDKLFVNFKIVYDYDKDKKEININKLSIGSDNVGDFKISARFGNIHLDPKKIVFMIFAYSQIMLHEAKISYQDNSFVERIIKTIASKTEKDVEEFKNGLIKIMEKVIKNENDAFTKKALNEIKNFINDPEKLSISISPLKPQPFKSMMRVKDPKDLINLLNIQIKSKK